MERRFLLSNLFTIIFICVLHGQQLTPADRVDTRVGTSNSVTKTAGRFGKGTEEFAHTLPAVLAPFGMNFWTPQTRSTEQKGVCPYIYNDSVFHGIRCSHWIVGGCTQDYGSFTILPVAHKPVANDTTLQSCFVPINHEKETATPSYYSLTSDAWKVELTASARAGILRITYSNPDSMYLLVRVNNDFGEGQCGIINTERAKVAEGMVWGINPIHRIYQGWGERSGHCGYSLMDHDAEVEAHGFIDKSTLWLKFKPQSTTVCLRAANSFTSHQNAGNNLESEIPSFNFDSVRTALHEAWNRKLGQVEIEGASDDALAKFYGAMYRCSFLPHVISDADGTYPTFADGKPRNDNHLANFHITLTQFDYYDDYSLWDTYRAQHPLLTILEPQREGEMLQSLVRKYEQGGWMPIFPCWNSYTAAMIGDHTASVFADAYAKGIRNCDFAKAYEGMRKNAFESPATYEEYCNGMGRRALKSYLQYGYIPLEDSVKEAFHQHEQVSRTLEYAYDDYCLAQLAKQFGTPADYRQLVSRSSNWKNVFDPTTGWVNGRRADGTFLTPTDTLYIKEREKNYPDSITMLLTPTVFSTFITEGVPAHYSWYVPHDVKGLIKAMGGKARFEQKLDSMFVDGFYWHGNEPCHQVAYLYNAIGKQWKTARVVRNILNTEYLNAPGGLSGNDDAGQMSAWYIFSALGFYPVCPGSPQYYIGSPTFPKAVLQLENDKTFTIVAHNASEDNIYIKSVKLNGRTLGSPYLSHEDIMRGGRLELEMTARP